MSRDLSNNVLNALFASRTGAVFCTLICIEHSSLASPIYLTNNGCALTYKGHEYRHFLFQFDPPDEAEGSFANAVLTIDATDHEIADIILNIDTAPTITIEAVFTDDDGGTFEPVATYPFILSEANGDANTITGTLTFDDTLDCELGPIEMTPSVCPGIN